MSTFAKRHELTAGIAVAAVFGGLAALILTLVWGAFWAGLAASVLGAGSPCRSSVCQPLE